MEEKNLQAFLAENAVKAENIKYIASKRFINADRNPIEWEIQTITSDEDETLRNSCKKKEFVPGTRQTSTTLDQEKYATALICKCVVYPNLNDAGLQDSYGVVGAEEVVKKMLTPGEYTDLFMAVQQANGFQTGMDEKIKTAKN
ncbi:phage tail assembly chaperone [Pectinatus frisingensis]|uniref:phage tail assembly chaperone n=1 Tax=Pectinatus frisingensis TaxID=865 RepID=UPI0015F3E6D8|nr:phage portal protein [Pectinatus frisingensis]